MAIEPDLAVPRRSTPRPAHDENLDSVEISPPRRPVGRPKKAAEPVIQFSTRLGLSYREIIDAVEAETGDSIRSIIEHALRTAYPAHYGRA
ncbi:Uncharacterised protein [Mycobacteroides abscessus subsp. abscessus]|nr:Uncharacterised protein [Mycobacteroides abscessus subsp. abscessus]SHR91487.1 Uncharacterised protein [Mycobacteroides abscessus subsp. abscessus]SIH64564.1 Uncharacterised protein [Mycobacteroides abscessus subsp. abscessus]